MRRGIVIIFTVFLCSTHFVWAQDSLKVKEAEIAEEWIDIDSLKLTLTSDLDSTSVVKKKSHGKQKVEQPKPVFTDEFLDSTNVKKAKNLINDYTLVGIQYGMGLNEMSFNPHMEQSMLFTPINIGFLYTRYGKIFGYMPYFGIQLGLFYTKEGYYLDEGYNIQGARKVTWDVVEFPALAHMHFDFWKMKFMVNIGFYVSYRLTIDRSGDIELPPALVNNFLSTDHRFNYGIKGGAGFGLIFDPIEIHLMAHYKYGFASMYDANYYSEYYYRFATDSNFIFSIGVHFQLTKRTGKTRKQLKSEAQEIYLQRKGERFNNLEDGQDDF